MQNRANIYLRVSRNSEANASEFLETIDEMLPVLLVGVRNKRQ